MLKKILIVALWSTAAFGEAVPGSELLSYFSSNCRTQGEWTRAALSDSRALIETLKSLSQDPDCRSVTGAVSQLELLNQQLQSVQNLNSTQIKVAEINAKEQELLIQLTQVTDADAQAEINTHMRDLQVERAGLLGKDSAQRELIGPDKGQLMAGIVQVANTTFSQLVGNQKCLAKNSAVLNSATSVISAIGATAAVVNPVLGLGLSAGATLLGETIEGVRQYNSAARIRKLADNSLAFEAYKCALETMSERWCQMKDAESFLMFKASQRRREIDRSDLGVAIRLNDREIPVILEWLNKIRAGVTPTTTADAYRQSATFQREALVRSLEAEGVGMIEQNRRIYNSYTNLDERWVFLRGLTNTLIPVQNTQSMVRNPLYDIFPMGYAPYFMLGIPDDQSIRNNNGDYIPFMSWQKPAGFNPTIDGVKAKYLEWVNLARARVNQELNQVLQPDPLQTLSSAFDRTDTRMKISPMESLKSTINFLKQNPPHETNLAFKKIYEGTLKNLEDIYSITEQAVLVSVDTMVKGDDGTDRPPVEAIYEIAQLKYGTVVLQARLELIVRLSLLELLQRSKPEDQVIAAQILASDRFSDTLAKMSGTDNLAVIRADINRAQPIVVSNLDSFIRVFGKNVNRLLKKFENEESESTGTVAKAKRYARTELCFLLLSVPNVAEKIDIEYCSGLKFDSVIPGGPQTVTLSNEFFHKDLNDRACTYREFFRQSKIYENWGVR